VGLALGAAVASWVEWYLLRRRLSRRLGAPVRSGWARPITVAAAAAGAVMFLLGRLPVPSPVDAVVLALGGLAVYALGLWLQGLRPQIAGRLSVPTRD
jgi:peptidoglycan biosynthesis protein MviN/MurJ (putative lipid II flippase)